ncbi:MAG: oligosaccharide flippase family protein [Candidatus Eremiobacteraeota bacterium]|nr:oligosaccharide flippase family protein [Candidatus Eremiobacteraeota bacterium]MBV8366668.1 oligosaccharide flippase family protein [Candidatus Eremiobacteraeota bacterium]
MRRAAAEDGDRLLMSDIPRRSLETLVLSVLGRAIAMAGNVVVARVLGPAGKGIVTYALSILTFVLELFCGQTSAIAYQYGRRGTPLRTVYGAMIKVLVLLVLPISAGITAIALTMKGQGPLIAAAAALPLAAYVQATRGFFLADAAVRAANIQALVAPATFAVAGSVALLVTHGSLWVLLGVFVLSYVPATIYTVRELRTLHAQRAGEPVQDPVRNQLVFGSQVGAVNLVNFLNNRVDLFIIIFVLGVKAVGVYSVSIAIAEVLWQMSGPVAVAAYGPISTLSEPEAAKLTAKCIRNTLPIAFIVSIGTFFLAPPLVTFVFGQPFAEAGYVARYFLPGAIAWSAMYHINTFLTIQLGRPQLVLWIQAVSATICAAVTLALVHPLGIASGAIGSSIAYIVGTTWAVIYFLRHTGLNPLELVAFGKDDLRRYLALAGWVLRSAGTAFAR